MQSTTVNFNTTSGFVTYLASEKTKTSFNVCIEQGFSVVSVYADLVKRAHLHNWFYNRRQHKCLDEQQKTI